MNLTCKIFIATALIASANLVANEAKDLPAITLNLSDRQLLIVPQELFLQNSLKELWLDDNQISEVPDRNHRVNLPREI